MNLKQNVEDIKKTKNEIRTSDDMERRGISWKLWHMIVFDPFSRDVQIIVGRRHCPTFYYLGKQQWNHKIWWDQN